MALTTYENKGVKHLRTKVDRRLYMNAARDRLVAEGHPDAAWVYASKGKEVPTAELEAFGPVIEVPTYPPKVEQEPEPKPKPKPKARPRPAASE